MSTEDIIDAWASMRVGGPFDEFAEWFSSARFELEEEADAATRDLSIELRLVFAELSRGDLSIDEAISEIDKLIPATAARPLRRSLGELDVLRDESTSEATTQRQDVILAGR